MPKPFAALLALFLSACATQLGVRNTSDQRVTMFSQVVFSPDYDSRRTDFVTKWTTPIRVHLRDRDTVFVGKYKGVVNKHAEALSKLTGIKISLVTESNSPNVSIYFDSRTGIKQYAKVYARETSAAQAALSGSGCYSEIDKNASYQITGARIFVHAEKAATRMLSTSNNQAREADEATRLRVNRCLTLEMIRIMGFRNSSDILTPSIFNADRYLEQTTVLDLQLIRTLYKPELRAGMPRAEALKAAMAHLQN